MEGPHVIGVGQPKVIIETVLGRKEFFVVAKMPLPVTGRSIALLFAELGDCYFVCMNTQPGRWTQRAADAG